MSCIVQPLEGVGKYGIAMATGDGIVRHCHPIFAVYVGDYPEQVLMTGIKTGECPNCPVPQNELGNITDYDYHDMDDILQALASFSNLDPRVYAQACKDQTYTPSILAGPTLHPYI